MPKEVVIRIENLSKQYRIGEYKGYKTFREAIVNAVKTPFRLARSLHSSSNDTIWALNDVSFEVKQGDVLGIIGQNGAGKSTLLKILSKITEPTKGRVELRGRVGSLLEVGTGFHPELTGHENIYLYGAILGMDRWEVTRKFDEIVAFAEIEKFIETPVKRYSSGMYTRLAFAVAAHMETEVLLVDEVLSVGDASFQKKCLGKMGEISRAGRTVLFVSHNMNAVEQLCTSCLMLSNGRLEMLQKDVRSVIKRYLFGRKDALASNEWVNSEQEYRNPYFHPLRFFLCDENGTKLEMPVGNNVDISIQIEAEIEIMDPSLTVGYAIYSENGSLLYWTYQTDDSEDNWPKLHEGLNILRGKNPRRLLNEGVYKIELIGGLHHREWLFTPGIDAPSIFMVIQGGLSDSPHWMGKRPGLIAPTIKWILAE